MRNIFFLAAIVALVACKNKGSESKMQAREGTEPPADFKTFYEKFHTDSIYQMSHISWPLKGVGDKKNDSSMVVGKIFREWEPETWILHKPFNVEGSTEFARTLEVYGEEMVVERIKTLALNYGQERHFTRREDGDWELIYYAEMQEQQ
jgi:hypothetical protein